jgi:DtxR family Mn-dependent transcriptional regulator
MPSQVEESYLELIYNLAMEESRVRAVDLADKFGVSRPTVAQTLKRLGDLGYITQDRTTGVQLTELGQVETEGLLRRHRLAERLMFDVLGMDFISAHEQAHSLEHWISPEVEDRIQTLLGAPQTCPHGNPIPGNAPGGIDYLRSQNAFRLSMATPGDAVIVVSISEVVEDETALLHQLHDTGIAPGRTLNVQRVADEVSYKTTSGSTQTLPADLAGKIWVRQADSVSA